MESVKNRVYELAEEVATGHGFEVQEVKLLGRGRRMLLRVTLDKEGGVTLDDCATFSRDFEALLDVEDPISGPYTLEVSSPGLDRPIRDLDDFRKQVGKLIRVVTVQKIEDQSFFAGRLAGVEGDSISLLLDKGKQLDIRFDNISKARLEIEIK